jgi:hypothetical protein
MKTWFSPSARRLAGAAAFALILWFASIFPVVAAEAPDRVDHRYYALDGWIGAIGLPDDCFKCVVDADGRFITELGKSKGHQGVYPHPPAQNRLSIQADVFGGTTRVSQRMHSPRVPIAITQKRYKDIAITERLFAAWPLDWTAHVKGDALRRRGGPDTRQYLLMVEYVNQGAQPVDITPVIQLQGYPWAKLNESRRLFTVTHNTQCSVSREIESFEPKTSATTPTTQATVVLKKLLLQPGGRETWFLAINRNTRSWAMLPPGSWAGAEAVRTRALEYWKKRAALPYDVIRVPDPEIQAILDTSIRELYQMRYVIRGLPAYFFGPGCYNDYWILDGSFVTEAMDMLGSVEDAGGYADYLLLHQQKDGRIQCMNEHWKETGIALVTLFRHARMTQDREWLLKRWPQFVRGVEAVQTLRRTGSSADPKALNYRLSPVGFGDGGIGREAEYTNNHWLLAGMRAAIEAAEWLGKAAETKAWKEQYADFQDAFRKAIQRDAKTDANGNRYIPAVMGPKTPQFPTRGQWAFCQGVYPGRIFAPDDEIMLGTMKMLQANEVQGGIIENSGWIGIWAQCGSFYGHDWLWLGNGRKAAELLYAFANHASPLDNFREEMPKQTKPGEKFPYARGGGDMPHVSASAEFIRLTGHLLAFDRGDELHLLEGLPSAWLKPGGLLRLNGLRTPFGPLRLTLTVSQNGTVASLHIAPLSDSSCRKIVLHFGAWSADGSRPPTDLAPDRAHDLAFRVPR